MNNPHPTASLPYEDQDQALRLHADRLAAMGKLAAGVAHEVNNPAAFVTANTTMIGEHTAALTAVFRLLRDVAAEEGEFGKKLERILSAYDVDMMMGDLTDIVTENLDGMGRITAIVRDLRSFSRIEPDVTRAVHPNEVVNSACSLVNTNVRHRALLVKHLGDTPMIVGDAGRLTQVLTNLLLNASQAIPENAVASHTVTVRTQVRGAYVVFSVEDDGPGIPPDVLPRIFEPFFTTKAPGEGTGLGLALAREIARSFNGELTVSSPSSGGAVFELSIPIVGQPIEVASLEETGDIDNTPASGSGSGGGVKRIAEGVRVLLVDDDPLILKAYQRSFKRSVETVTANGGHEAIDLLAFDDSFDVIVCDLMMPRMGGQAVYETLEKTAPHLVDRIIFVSGGIFSGSVQGFIDRIDNPLLEKPVPWAKLADAVGKIVSREND